MKQRFLLTLAVLFGVIAVLALAVNLIATDTPEPPPDPTLVITLPDGRDTTLGELVERSLAGLPLVEPETTAPRAPELPSDAPGSETPLVVDAEGEPVLTDQELQRMLRGIQERRERLTESTDIYDLAELARYRGDAEQALALYRSVPAGHPEYGRAQRRIGWDVYAELRDEPARGVPFVHASLRDDPFDGNAWQDAARVYAATLGLPVD